MNVNEYEWIVSNLRSLIGYIKESGHIRSFCSCLPFSCSLRQYSPPSFLYLQWIWRCWLRLRGRCGPHSFTGFSLRMKWWIGLYQARGIEGFRRLPSLRGVKKGDHSYQMHTKSGGGWREREMHKHIENKFKKSSSSSSPIFRNPKEMDPSRSKKLGARPTLTPRTWRGNQTRETSEVDARFVGAGWRQGPLSGYLGMFESHWWVTGIMVSSESWMRVHGSLNEGGNNMKFSWDNYFDGLFYGFFSARPPNIHHTTAMRWSCQFGQFTHLDDWKHHPQK